MVNKMESTGRLLIAGDLFPNEANVSLFSNGDIVSLFGDDIIALFNRADYSVCNLEGAISDNPGKCVKTGPVKTAPASVVKAYKELGVSCCMLANNHVTDGGNVGLTDTVACLEASGIEHIGAVKDNKSIQRSLVKEIGGLTFGFYNVGETMYNKPTEIVAGVWLYDESLVREDLLDLRQRCDYLIVLYHGGIEKFPYPSPELRKRFHRMADWGANLVVSQHTHCLGCEEDHNGSLLIYGQGDFLLKNFYPGITDSGMLLELVVDAGRVEVVKHRIRCVDDRFVRLDANQGFSDYFDRSSKLGDTAFLTERLKAFCAHELVLYLSAYKSPSRFRRWQRAHFPEAYKKWLFGSAFKKRDLLFALHTLRSEQNRETAVVGLEGLLDMGQDYYK